MFKELIKRQDITYAQIGRKLKVSREAVSAWARGVSAPPIKRVPDLAKILDCTIEEIVLCFKEK
jgi:DNA-binding helix-turn-helix protein|nr:MAG TPA: helix-turn-helix domain protein [Caudoviricetes sp.]